MTITRRGFFITGLASVGVMLTSPVSALKGKIGGKPPAPAVNELQELICGSGKPATNKFMSFFMSSLSDSPDKGFTIDRVDLDFEKDGKTMSQIYDEIPVWKTFKNMSTEEMAIEYRLGSNEIASKTLRGIGQYYLVTDDGILIFYHGRSHYDFPFYRYENKVFIRNENWKDYFCRIKGDPKELVVAAQLAPHLNPARNLLADVRPAHDHLMRQPFDTDYESLKAKDEVLRSAFYSHVKKTKGKSLCICR